MNNKNWLLFFDSGIGGISIVNHFNNIRKNVNFIYYADILNFPYGEKDEIFIGKILFNVYSNLKKDYKISLIIIVCNTASVSALEYLRERIKIPIIGNGDIDSPEKANEYFNKYGVDGIMIGRPSVGKPWIFRDVKHYLKTGKLINNPTVKDKVEWAKEQFQRSIEWKGEKVGIFEMRKHFSNYFKGIINILKQMNYSEYKRKDFNKYEEELNKTLIERSV